ncbi:DUF2505 domain-containing protein [Paraferrimonas sedimenticola]|uniref:DUF2505 domain-containing protein n=1 Tax=Paraferrimonas sedimenticola TaxID=375674 RepID=A0AA37VUG1_9GAMM|nr:DUF2505 domain-containing protein [Paraferrimonas sedimenticola]GLP95889.1 hypothetical protein GCM10007895_11950 [Paraferrimonas sedimenticola]
MQIRISHDYQCDPDTLYFAFADGEAVEQKYLALGADAVEFVDHQISDEGCELVTRRELESDIPKVLQSILGQRNTIEQSERWRSEGLEHLCQLKIKLLGVPINIQGQLHIRPTDSGCTNDIQLLVKSAIPLIGGQLEKFVANQCAHMIEAEYAYLTKNLAVSEQSLE